MLTTKQAAEIANLSVEQIKRLCRYYEIDKSGIKAKKFGRSWMIEEKDLKRYLTKREKGACKK